MIGVLIGKAIRKYSSQPQLDVVDFLAAFRTLGVPENVFARIKNKYIGLLPKFKLAIGQSFLSDPQKEAYTGLLERRIVFKA